MTAPDLPPYPGRCPCGLGSSYAKCCRRLHRGERSAATAEQLMRSRYSAFVVGDEAYLRRTWHPSTRPRRVRVDPAQRWAALEVLATTGGGLLDDDGTVEFVAHFTHDGQPGQLHEHSRFVRHDGEWTYVDPLAASLT